MTHKILILIVSIIALPGCGKRYTSLPLKPVHKRAALYSEKKEMVKIRIKRLTQQQTNKLCNGRGKRLKKTRYGQAIVPLHLTIKNYNAAAISIAKNDIDLPLIDYKIVAQRMLASTTKRVAALTVIGLSCAVLSFAGSCVCGLVGAMSGLPLFIAASYGTGALSGAFLVGTPVVTYLNASHTRFANEAIDKDMYYKTVVNTLVIKPLGEETFLIFVSERDLKDRFALKISKEDGTEVVFPVSINPS